MQPGGREQSQFKYLWLYGLIDPKTGDSFFYEFSHLDSICFEKYWEIFAQKYPDDLQIIQLDKGWLHHALDITIPDNILLLFQPAYSPQVNPIELWWSQLKSLLRQFSPTSTKMVDTIIAVALDLINPKHLKNWFTNCCYCTS